MPGTAKYFCGQYSEALRTGRSGNLIPVEVRFSIPFQTCRGAHPASYTMGIGTFSEVKPQRRGADHQPLSSVEVKEN